MSADARPKGEEWVVAIRLRQLGDVLASLEVVRALKEYAEGRRVAYVVDAPYGALLGSASFIDRLLVPPRRRSAAAWSRFLGAVRSLRPCAAVDFHGSARSALIALASGAPVRVGYDVRGRRLAYTVREPRGEFRDGVRVPHTPIEWGARLARHIGAAPVGALAPRMTVTGDARERGRARLAHAGVDVGALESGRVMGINPGRPAETKAWGPERFIALSRRLAADGDRVVVFWGPGEERVARTIADSAGTGVVAAPALRLEETPAILTWMSALATIDSGLKHLAVCLRVPTVTVFGSTDPSEWHMGGAHDRALWRGLSCSPCRRLTCPIGVPCLDIAPDAVYASLQSIRSVPA